MNRTDKPIVVGAGELLWDCFPDGRRPGGAPANVAFHAQQLGLDGIVYSRVGDDSLGAQLLEFLAGNGLSVQYVQRDLDHETGRVTVDLSQPEHPSYTIHENAAWDQLSVDEPTEQLAAQASAICFGTLAQRSPTSRRAIHTMISSASDQCRIVYDVNLRAPWYEPSWIERSLRAAHVVKLNDEEVDVVADLLHFGRHGPERVAHAIQEQFGVPLVCITRGSDGCLLVDENTAADVPGMEVQVADPVGAGDAFTAALIYAQLHSWPLATTATFANRIAALVAGSPGAMPDLGPQYRKLLSQFRSQEL